MSDATNGYPHTPADLTAQNDSYRAAYRDGYRDGAAETYNQFMTDPDAETATTETGSVLVPLIGAALALGMFLLIMWYIGSKPLFEVNHTGVPRD